MADSEGLMVGISMDVMDQSRCLAESIKYFVCGLLIRLKAIVLVKWITA
jgi:hypothetical protein